MSKEQYFSPEYTACLNGLGEHNRSADLIAALNNGDLTSRAELASGTDHSIEYVDTRKLEPGIEENKERLLFYVPGFTEGIVAKSPFLVSLKEKGIDVIMPNQHREGTPKVKDTTRKQALDYMAIIGNEGLQHKKVNLFGHSYGSMVAAEMVGLADEMGWTCFEDAEVILGAPAGIGNKTGVLNLGSRFMKMLKSEGKASHKEIYDNSGEMFKAGQKTLLANPLRAAKEVLALHKYRINAKRLGHKVGGVSVLGYSNDKLFTHEILEGGIDSFISHGARYMTPIRFITTRDGVEVDHGRPATHNDEQFNPTRVAGAVNELI